MNSRKTLRVMDNEETDLPSFKWQIPSLTPDAKLLLCQGFVKNNTNKYIIPDIIKLFAMFYTNNLYTMKEIKSSKIAQRFHGPVFSINEFKFYFEFYPNGTSSHHEGQIASFLCLTSLPPNIQHIQLSHTLQSTELDCKLADDDYDFDTDAYWRGIYSETCKLQNLNTLSFNLEIKQLSIYHKNGHIEISKSASLHIKEIKPTIHLWEVSETETATKTKTETLSEPYTEPDIISSIQHAPNVYGYASDIFIVGGIKWYLTFYPNGSKIARAGYPNVYLHLAALPDTNIAANIRHSQGLNGDYKMRDAKFVTVFDIDRSSWGLIEESTYNTKDLYEFSNFLCVAELIMLDIYKNDKVIELKDKFENKQEQQHIQILKDLEIKMFEWELDDVIMECIKNGNLKEMKCESAAFEIFGIKWRLILWPNGKNEDVGDVCIGLRIVDGLNDYTLSVRLYFEILELKKRYITSGIFDKERDDIDWGDGRIKTNDIKELKTCTVRIGIELVDVYKKCVCVVNDYVRKL